MTTLLHACADGEAPAVVTHEAVARTRWYERVTDYAHATPGGLRWLTLHELSRPVDDLDGLAALVRRRASVDRPGDPPSGSPPASSAADGGAPAGAASAAASSDPSSSGAWAVVATVFEQISPAEGWLTADGMGTRGELPVGDAVLSVVMDVEESALEQFHGWYDEEHLPKLVAVPGIDAARRFRAVAGDLAEPGRRRFLALYELAGLDFLETAAWAEAASMTPRTEQIVPHVVINSQMYRR